MKLEYPLIISARLLPAVAFSTFTVSLDPATWEYWIDFCGEASGTETITGSDFSPSPFIYRMPEDQAVREAMETLLSFISAFAEAVQFNERHGRDISENSDMFPERFAEWASFESDEISGVMFDLTLTEGVE